jgi:pyrimidine-nucleoside phosphorylase
MSFDPITFIAEKRDGKKHSPDDIAAFVKGAVSGEIKDYQVSAWLMAVCLKGLSFRETFALTKAMAESGKIYEWDRSGPPLVDKHSTGGVGDTVTLIAAPLVASMGMRMGKHSGRGLGHTGGTIDKLESIPHFRTKFTEDEFKKIVNTVGCAIASQDEDMTPADGMFYSLRDVTATVDSEALIASSIMSKKIAGGSQSLLLDIKVGHGAFMKNAMEARSLANLMIRLGRSAGINVKSLLTSMDEPLGNAIGNALEVKEAIAVLNNQTPFGYPLRLVSIEIAARLSVMSGIETLNNARTTASKKIASGDAAEKFKKMIEMQGGNPEVVDKPAKFFHKAQTILKIPSPDKGFVSGCDALAIGELVRDLGGGRKLKSDKIDPEVGVVLHVRRNDHIEAGQTLCEVHTNNKPDRKEVIARATEAFRILRKGTVKNDLFLN